MDPIKIYADLKEKIIWLDIEPGATLNLVELAKSYGVSRNPVMIALTRLNVEEWVVRQGVHFVVSPLTAHVRDAVSRLHKSVPAGICLGGDFKRASMVCLSLHSQLFRPASVLRSQLWVHGFIVQNS